MVTPTIGAPVRLGERTFSPLPYLHPLDGLINRCDSLGEMGRLLGVLLSRVLLSRVLLLERGNLLGWVPLMLWRWRSLPSYRSVITQRPCPPTWIRTHLASTQLSPTPPDASSGISVPNIGPSASLTPCIASTTRE